MKIPLPSLWFLSALVSFVDGNLLETPLQTQEHVTEGQFFLSHPAEVRMVDADSRHLSVAPEKLLRVTMETVIPDQIGGRRRNLFFTQQYLSDYIEAIDHFLRLAGDHPTSGKIELARVKSWESFNQERDLVFEYIPNPDGASGTVRNPLLAITLMYDFEHRGGTFYFSAANARELLNLLFGFIDEV